MAEPVTSPAYKIPTLASFIVDGGKLSRSINGKRYEVVWSDRRKRYTITLNRKPIFLTSLSNIALEVFFDDHELEMRSIGR